MERHQSRNILLVEDEPLIALKEQRLLERAGYSVKTAHSGEQAVEKCGQASGSGEPDLVLMDIDLGEGIEGVEAAGRILERRDLPVVFLTSHTEREYVDRVKQVSRYGYVLKSSGELMLLESIAMAFELFEAHQATKRQKAQYERLFSSSEEAIAGRAINKAIEAGTPYDFEKRIVRPDGEVRWVHSRGEVVHNEQGEPVKLVGSFLDITERKQAQIDLQKALAQKNQLMRELNHRVKNNLHMVSSLISLKDAALGDAVDLSDIMSQVDTIAFIYEKLQRSDHAGLVDFATYARDLVTSIFNQRFVGGIQIDIRIGDLQLPAKTATTLGLIINELATNAAKYGFAAEGAQRFTVSMETEHHDDAYTLTVSNTGHRFPDHVEPERAETLGLQLVYGLTAELDGAIELHRDPETTFTIRFPAPGRGAADAFSTDAGREGVIGA